MTLFAGYDPSGRPVTIVLDDDRVFVEDAVTGEREPWNDEDYTEDDRSLIRFSLLAEGYRF